MTIKKYKEREKLNYLKHYAQLILQYTSSTLVR